MLVLTRRPQEILQIGNDITITILQSSAGAVRLGINAPANVVVHREEVIKRINSGQPKRQK